MDLYIAEKKVLAEAIASAIEGAESRQNGAIYKGDAVITWCSGHLLTLMDPEDYDEKYKKWTISDLPIYFSNWKMKIPDENKKRVYRIGELIKKADMVVNCGDVDEEGQLLVDEILRYFNYKGPCKRLDTANTTTVSLRKALKNMKDNSECVSDGWSAYARMVADKMFGINLSRYYTKTYNALLPVGRVQTPTLGMVVARDMLIETHQKQYYYSLNVDVEIENIRVTTKYVPNKELPELEEGKFLTDDFLRHLKEKLPHGTEKFLIQKKREEILPPLPFNLTELNNYCGKKWGYTPDKVMKITQSLRDNFAAITYNRSDCQYLSMEHFNEAPETVAAACANLGMETRDFDTSQKSKCFNDANITAHFAIIPTAEHVEKDKLSIEQFNVYDIICKYYLIQFMPPCIMEKTLISAPILIDGKNVGEISKTVSVVQSAGFKFLLDRDHKTDNGDEKENNALCHLSQGEKTGRIIDSNVEKNETKPPSRYNQTTLYSDMTKISKYVQNPDIKKLLLEKDKDKKGENGSIGTSATRGEIIKNLIKRGYLEERKEGKKIILISTEKGRKFYKLLPDAVKKADTTALWWVVQEDIKKGSCSHEKLPLQVLETIKDVMAIPADKTFSAIDFMVQSKVLCRCPACGGDIVSGKFGPFCKNKCGFILKRVFGKKITDKQFVSLCNGRKTKISGIEKKSGDGTYNAYAVPEGVEDFSYQKDGKIVKGKQLKCKMTFK